MEQSHDLVSSNQEGQSGYGAILSLQNTPLRNGQNVFQAVRLICFVLLFCYRFHHLLLLLNHRHLRSFYLYFLGAPHCECVTGDQSLDGHIGIHFVFILLLFRQKGILEKCSNS
ncbi:hypothetical protein GDO78_017813 [Eleutherodactylus coqui]|uniref:Uncharacterized protein n=1 Tax=Eleutherodactylus coqui TaxID=57060 RepID=A0A8J6EK62_ELECQ|nr:hypothetical protein GDO78_017813 [Eleutherodactylus coqui]